MHLLMTFYGMSLLALLPVLLPLTCNGDRVINFGKLCSLELLLILIVCFRFFHFKYQGIEIIYLILKTGSILLEEFLKVLQREH